MQEKIKEILDQIETVIVGKNAVMERILMAILAGGGNHLGQRRADALVGLKGDVEPFVRA